MKIVVIGGSGLIGSKLVARLREFYRQRDETEMFEPVDLVAALSEAVSMTQPTWRDAALAQAVPVNDYLGIAARRAS